MARRAATPRLRDIIDAIDHVRSETEGVTLEMFEADTGAGAGWWNAV